MVANGLEGVPWMISGADHSADIARVLAYAATSGTSGIILPGDLKVVPSGTPNMQVHVGVGAFAVVNKSGVQSQSYVGRGTAVSDLTVATTGSSARSDLVVVRIKDPQFAPYQGLYTSGSDQQINGPYAFPEIIPGVAANTVRAEQLNLPQSLYAVARIDVPAGTTSGITAGMIKDLRGLVAPHYTAFNGLQRGPAARELLATTDTAWKNWPSNSVSVEIPAWATHCDVSVDLIGWEGTGPGYADTQITLGPLVSPNIQIDYNGSLVASNNVIERLNHTVAGSLDVTSVAGTTQTLRMQAKRLGNTGSMAMDTKSLVRFRAEFFQRPM